MDHVGHSTIQMIQKRGRGRSSPGPRHAINIYSHAGGAYGARIITEKGVKNLPEGDFARLPVLSRSFSFYRGFRRRKSGGFRCFERFSTLYRFFLRF